jgi:hypothetical protein
MSIDQHGSQMFIAEMRMECANFMEKHEEKYGKFIHGGFKDYVTNLRKASTCGTLLELRMMSDMFK